MKPFRRSAYGTGPMAEDKYEFDQADREFSIGSPRHSPTSQRPHGEHPVQHGDRWSHPTYDKFGMEIGEVDVGLSEPRYQSDPEFVKRLRPGSRQAEEDWDFVRGSLGVDQPMRPLTKTERKRQKQQRKRARKFKNDEGSDSDYENFEKRWLDSYEAYNSEVSDSDSDENEVSDITSEDTISVDDPEEAERIDRRF